jgi:hypothetical protein
MKPSSVRPPSPNGLERLLLRLPAVLAPGQICLKIAPARIPPSTLITMLNSL